jgi:pimeloyl-ACP methyl ester carboxylesterase/DNA-binding winged helix-turn-helix (wHTH) protein
MNDSGPRIYRFGSFELDPQEGRLLKRGRPVALTPKAFETLLVLVENQGHVLSREELMHRLWPDTFVEENNLSQNISLLRKALGDTDCIETAPRRGYRFAMPVHLRPLTPASATAREEPVAVPETRYARSGDVNIAYQVIGDGPVDVVFVMGWVSHLEYFWTQPLFAHFLRRLASFSRLILFDKRGTGLSDRVPLAALPTLEQRMDDVRAVMDAAGSERAAICGISEGGPMSALFAATYPEKTIALVMIGCYAKRIRSADYPWGPTDEEREKFYDQIQQQWGGPVGLEERAPSVARDASFRDWWATYLRMGSSPGAAVALTKMNADIDVRNVLPSVRIPTLVIHRTGDRCLKVEEGRYVAALIPGARMVELPGEDHLPFVGDQDAILDEVEEFLIGVRHTPEPERVLATVLFLQSDERGSEGWQRLHGQVQREVEWFRGKPIRCESEVVAIFDGPARAIRCASALIDVAYRSGLLLRAGLHTGECDLDEHGGVWGVAVEIASRVVESCGPGEVLVSNTVRDLVAGSGLQFVDAGTRIEHATAGEWRLFRVVRGKASGVT